MGWLPDETGLDRCPANHVPLTPLSHLSRAVTVWPGREAVVYGNTRLTYGAYHQRVSRLASALARRGIAPGAVVSTVLPNVPAQVEAHFGVPAAGAIINAINVRLDIDTVAYILDHGQSALILCDTQFLPLVEAAKAQAGCDALIVECPDPGAGYPATGRHLTYEDLLAEGDPDAPWVLPEDEWESLALNYTSGTTGKPKGVVYSHRGAYLNTMGQVISWRMVLYPRYLTIVPLFHCNGWCHSWMMPVLGGTVVCCRDITAKAMYDAFADEGITHWGGAPIVLNMLVHAQDGDRRPFDQTIEVFTAGAPPAAATLEAIEPLGFHITQVYGLTEVYGPATECTWQEDDWDGLAKAERFAIKARQGVSMPMMEPTRIADPESRALLPMDGKAQGEIVMRGNGTMKGYYKNPDATAKAFADGWFWTGDLAIQHPDSYVQIADRAKDIIISGGENVSSVEVESVLMRHPAVLLCAVVAKPDDKWGEVPCAFVEIKPGAETTEDALIQHCRDHLAGFKTPKAIVFQELPKTSTGKIQKFQLRAQLGGFSGAPSG